jgi:predicted Rossmann fold nucleotide-binding protein DprA/Smf involved in DNA uptake
MEKKLVVGFTGTRQIEKISKERLSYLEDKILALIVDNDFKITTVHGCAFGADSFFHTLCLYNNIPVIGRPTYNYNKSLVGFEKLYEPNHPLTRNRDIVGECDVLIALPINPNVEEIRSGTWFTIRYAKKLNKEVVII